MFKRKKSTNLKSTTCCTFHQDWSRDQRQLASNLNTKSHEAISNYTNQRCKWSIKSVMRDKLLLFNRFRFQGNPVENGVLRCLLYSDFLHANPGSRTNKDECISCTMTTALDTDRIILFCFQPQLLRHTRMRRFNENRSVAGFYSIDSNSWYCIKVDTLRSSQCWCQKR